MQIKALREEHEVTASNKPSVAFVMQGAICVGTEAHPKQKEIFPEHSQPGRRGPELKKKQSHRSSKWGQIHCGEWRPAITQANSSSFLSTDTKLNLMEKRSCFHGFCTGLSVWFLYLLYRMHRDKSPVLVRLSQAISHKAQ